METFLFTTAFRRPNGEMLPGDVRQLDEGVFRFNATESTFYFFLIKKDSGGNWYWLDGHTASVERVLDLGEKVDAFLAR